MTAKEQLLEIVDDLSEEDAIRIFPFLSGHEWAQTPMGNGQRLSNVELLRLPAVLRDHILRAEVSQLTEEELAETAVEAEAWRFADADALKHLDG